MIRVNELATTVMIVICNYFLDECRDLFKKYPLMMPVENYIVKVRDGLVLSISSFPAIEAVEKLQMKSQKLDQLHDRGNRVLFNLIDTVTDDTSDEHYQQSLSELKEFIFPMGLSVNRLSRTREAGEAIRLETQLKEPWVHKLLLTITLGHSGKNWTGLELAQKIVAAGKALGDTLRKIEDVKASQENGSKAHFATQHIPSEGEARKEFYRMIRMLREVSNIALEEDREGQNRLWKLLTEERKRGASSQKSKESKVVAQGTSSTPSHTSPAQPS